MLFDERSPICDFNLYMYVPIPAFKELFFLVLFSLTLFNHIRKHRPVCPQITLSVIFNLQV